MIVTSDVSRPPGLHVSDIIKDMLQTLKPEVYGKPMDVTKVKMGLTFEEVLEKSFFSAQSGAFRPQPVKVDGIWCSPDGVDPELWAVEEFKLTWYSASKKFPDDPVYWPWLIQTRAYCYALDTRLVKFWILYVNGDYKPPRPWDPKVYGVEYTELEIQENWEMLVNHAKWRGWL